MALPDETQKRILEKYPGFAQFAAIPDLWDLWQTAVSEGLDAVGLQARLWKTSWWIRTPEEARLFQAYSLTDPAKASTLLTKQRESVTRLLSQLGLSGLEEEQIVSLSLDALREGLDAEQLRQRAVDSAFGRLPIGQIGGDAGALRDQLHAEAGQFALPISDSSLKEWTQNILAGRQTLDGYKEKVRRDAKGAYSHLADEIDRGSSVAQIFDPYRQTAAQKLEINPTEIDMSDPKWNGAINSIDAETGQRRSLTLSEWENKIRTDTKYGFGNTQQARETAFELATGLQQKLGQVA